LSHEGFGRGEMCRYAQMPAGSEGEHSTTSKSATPEWLVVMFKRKCRDKHWFFCERRTPSKQSFVRSCYCWLCSEGRRSSCSVVALDWALTARGTLHFIRLTLRKPADADAII
jgi:hypothetical protein